MSLEINKGLIKGVNDPQKFTAPKLWEDSITEKGKVHEKMG